MAQTFYLCEACRQELAPDDAVVVAAEQIDASSQDGPATIDGLRSFFHVEHWYGNDQQWAERGRGRLDDFIHRS
jgi:hypothetical protein